ncbi:hypothetical protein SARC_06042 [Sphaeroforma arctica JP610]|uniref:Ricin B lectin domain-containing protein n=1 Tax=Sphaeroforma arctica JP610 TaxID=667725 RepID=A0A0L0FXU7_9EUKA|nr:hypothetical protein SARC_06042 [Sphaeroforma arctica JP610]KNC81637.1 hypothetical protein SARC_06042 [Sphaeroforma arctica JP610]|eukprot:XP_014155539.1 hypothetical protein SARC_06042 [Sphaeroforma arctica JP610]
MLLIHMLSAYLMLHVGHYACALAIDAGEVLQYRPHTLIGKTIQQPMQSRDNAQVTPKLLSDGARFYIKDIQGLCLTAHGAFKGDLSLSACEEQQNNIWTFVPDAEVNEGYEIRVKNSDASYDNVEWCMYFAGNVAFGVENCDGLYNRDTRFFKTTKVDTLSNIENVVATITLESAFNRFEMQYNAHCLVSDPWNADELLKLGGMMCSTPVVKERLWHLFEAAV